MRRTGLSVSLGFGPKNPKRRLESGSPLLDPKLASPPHSPPNLICRAVHNDGTGTKQAAGPRAGSSGGLGAGLLLPGASWAGEGVGPGGLPSTPASWGLDHSPGEGAEGPGA